MTEEDSDNWKNGKVVNSLIENEIETYKQYKTNAFPAIVINEQTFRGQLEIEAVMNGICAGFMNPPSMCRRLLDSNDFHDTKIIFLQDDEVSILSVLMICLSIVGGVVLILCIYRRHVRRSMKTEINQ